MIVNNIAIEIEGVDKAGKDTILQYIAILANYKYTMNARGILSQLVYNEKFNRNYTYQLPYKPLIIFLDLNEEDHMVRCKLTHEPKINYSDDRDLFLKYIDILENNGITVWKYNTSDETAYNIAKDIIKRLENLDIQDFTINNYIKF